MHLILLTRFHSQHAAGPIGQRLLKTALALGHQLQVVNPADVVLEFGGVQGGAFPVLWRNQAYPRADLTLVLARTDDAHTWQIAETLQSWGHPVSQHLRVPLGDHVTMARLLARRNIPAPRSWVLSHLDQLDIIAPELEYPVVLRSRYGGSGRKLAVVQHSGELRSQAAMISSGKHPILVQDLPLPLGEDLRVLVVGEQILAAVERQAPQGFVRPKEEGNPSVKPTHLTETERQLALNAARLYGAAFCAVNLLRTPEGPKFLELSRVPTLAELEHATGKDLAEPIIRHLVALAERHAQAESTGPVVPFAAQASR